MNKCLAAWTETSGKSYPEYLNISYDESADAVVVTMREAPFVGGSSNHLINGNTASIQIPVGEFWSMWRNAMKGLATLPGVVQLP